MMQSYASAAKLRGSGPILHRGLEAMEGTSGHRHLGSSSAAPSMGRQSGCHVVLLFLVSPAIAHAAGRKMTPSGTSPVVTRRHSAMSSLRASATIIVLRVLPRPSAVRASNHFAKALSFWNLIKHQANWMMPRRTRAFPAHSEMAKVWTRIRQTIESKVLVVRVYRASDPADDGDPFGFEKKPKYKQSTKKMKWGWSARHQVWQGQFSHEAEQLHGNPGPPHERPRF
jgi:hypothetical protein